MEFSTILYFAALLACPIGMGAMIWMMGRNMHSQNEQTAPDAQMPFNASERLAELHRQQHALETEIAEMNKLVELEAQRDALRKEQAIKAAPLATGQSAD